MIQEIANMVNGSLFLLSIVIPAIVFAVVLFVHWAVVKRTILVAAPAVETTGNFLLAGYCASDWDMTAGVGRRKDFYDTDNTLRDFESSKRTATQICDKIKTIMAEQKDKVNWKVCFIEKDSGPVGCLTTKDLVSSMLGVNASVVRPRRKLDAASVKGEPLKEGDAVILVTDVVTTGLQLMKAIDKIEKFGAYVSNAVAVVDREEDKNDLFLKKRIPIHCVSTISNIRDSVKSTRTKRESA